MKLILLFAFLLIPAGQDDFSSPDQPCPISAKSAPVSMDAPDFACGLGRHWGRQARNAIPASHAAMTIADFKFRIVRIVFENTALGFVPMDIAASDRVVFVEFELLSGSRESFRNLQISLVGPSGQKMNAIIMASDGMIKALTAVTIKGNSSGYQPEKNTIAWAYVVPQGSDAFFLNFPTGEIVDLGPLIKRFP